MKKIMAIVAALFMIMMFSGISPASAHSNHDKPSSTHTNGPKAHPVDGTNTINPGKSKGGDKGNGHANNGHNTANPDGGVKQDADGNNGGCGDDNNGMDKGRKCGSTTPPVVTPPKGHHGHHHGHKPPVVIPETPVVPVEPPVTILGPVPSVPAPVSHKAHQTAVKAALVNQQTPKVLPNTGAPENIALGLLGALALLFGGYKLTRQRA